MGFVEMVFFPTKPILTKSKENGFFFQQNPLSEVYKNQKNCRASIFKLQATDCCAYAFEGIGILVSFPTRSSSNVCLCP